MSLHEIEHIGDGVYVQYNGYGIDIRVNDHQNPVAVVLEPAVVHNLNLFLARKQEEKAELIRKETQI